MGSEFSRHAGSMFHLREQAAHKSFNALEDLIDNLRWLRSMQYDKLEEDKLTAQIEKLLDAYEVAEQIALECDQIREHNQRD